MAITPVVSYLFTGLVGCSVNPRISHGVCKLIRTLRVIKKKKATTIGLLQNAIGFEEKDEVYAKLLNVETFFY